MPESVDVGDISRERRKRTYDPAVCIACEYGRGHWQETGNRCVEIVPRGIHVVQALYMVEDKHTGVDGEVPDLFASTIITIIRKPCQEGFPREKWKGGQKTYVDDTTFVAGKNEVVGEVFGA